MSTAAEYKKRENFQYFITHHRESVQAALALRKICPSCETGDCHYKCSRCFSVTYCSKTCQVSDWPKHKEICQIFYQLVKIVREIEEEDVHDDNFLATTMTDALCTRFRMHGFKAELTCVTFNCLATAFAIPWVVQSVIVDGRIYDILSCIFPRKYLGFAKLTIRPIPSYDELKPKEYAKMNLNLKALHNHQQGLPYSIPVDINENDWNLIAAHATLTKVSHLYLFGQCQRLPYNKFLLELFGEEVIQWASGKSNAQYLKDMDDMIQQKSRVEATAMWAEKCKKTWLSLPLKADTRSKVTHKPSMW